VRPAGALQSTPFLLREEDRDRLAARLDLAVQRARRSGTPTLATLTLSLPPEVDPSAVACASRRPGEAWFVFEQPERKRVALAALGEVTSISASGPGRFAEVAERWRVLAAAAVTGEADGPGSSAVGRLRHPLSGGAEGPGSSAKDGAVGGAGAGPIAVGGFAFAPDGGSSPHWSGFRPASLVVPEVALARDQREGESRVRMTLSALAAPDDTAEDLQARLQRRLSELRSRPLALLDPAPAGRCHVASTMPPEHYEAAVARAVELIRGGEMQKIVLAREVQVHAPGQYDPAAVFGVLRAEFPSCFVFCVGRGESTLVAASPELLVRREGHRVSTLALAGSTRRSADPAVDDHLGEQLLRSQKDREEQAIVVRRIERTLRQHALWVTATPEPVLVRVANIQHLGTPIRAQLARPLDAIELLELMHPTPAVGGEPLARARPLIPALEGLDRGWYAGPVGWTDATGDGEFCVALRCALLNRDVARCYAGVGVVKDSDPCAELAETEVKLAALLPLLSS
jgi:salicylate biosynthesis isochorismate synthase/menaquinone-specific isochorismate synthase